MLTNVKNSFIGVKWKFHSKAKVDEIELMESLYTLGFV
jgi:hypothetical protein